MKFICRPLFLIVLLYNFPYFGNSQLPANLIGNYPTNIKWNQIKTDRVQLIFPEPMGSKALRIANMIHYLADSNAISPGRLAPRVPIILHDRNVLSNGFVTVGPFRSEFFMLPPQFDCTTDWIESLAIHEYRHAMQFGFATQGITKTAKHILGSWAWGGMIATALPRWYFEGEAVLYETALTNSGRARLPAFLMEYKSLVLDGRDYSYEKASAGSLKDFVPDWYRLGSSMISYAQSRYGPDIMQEVVSDAVRYRGLFYPFSKSLQRRTGLSTPELFKKTMDSLEVAYASEMNQQANPGSSQASPDARAGDVTNYNIPMVTESGQILALKSSYSELPAVYSIDADSEERLFEPGILLDMPMASMSYRSGKLYWASLDFSQRRRYDNYSNIYEYDLNTGKKQKLSNRKRYYSPDISNDGLKLVAVQVDENADMEIVIVDAGDGEVIKILPNPEGSLYSYPKWHTDDQSIIVVRRKNEMNELVQIDLETGTNKILVPASFDQITHPQVMDEKVFFSLAYEGTNNIFSCSFANKDIHQITNVLTGAFQPWFDSNTQTLFFSLFGSRGYQIQKRTIDILSVNFDKSRVELATPRPPKSIAGWENKSVIEKIPDQNFEIEKFNKWSGIINPHSIIPILEDPIAGLQVLSDNTFSTLSADAGVFYNYNEDEWRYQAGLTYAELFPVIHLNYGRFARSSVLRNFQLNTDTSAIHTVYAGKWKENRATAGLSIPLNFSSGNMLNQLTIGAFYRRIGIDAENRFLDPDFSSRDTLVLPIPELQRIQQLESAVLTNQNFHAFDLLFDYRSLKRTAIQNIRPRKGFNIGAWYRSTFANQSVSSNVWLAFADIYFPGFSRNHNFYINLMAQGQNILDNYYFSDAFNYPRGFDFSFQRDEYYKVGFNYSLPLVYPDAAIGPYAFIKRIKSNFFFDYGWLRVHEYPFQETTDLLRSAGVEITFDFRAFRLLEVDLGIRYSFLIDDKFTDGDRHQFNFLLLKITDR